MIPRAISLIFKQMAADTHQVYTLHISYMEIYNSTAYDLLDPSRDIKELSDLPPVTILEDDEGRFHMRQLSLNPCAPSRHCHASQQSIVPYPATTAHRLCTPVQHLRASYSFELTFSPTTGAEPRQKRMR